MKHPAIIVAVGLALTAALSTAPAMALNGRSFVSPSGSDGNPCTLALPCRNLQAALNQTNPGGEISILGTAGYSGGATLTIDRAISIVNPGAFEAGISPPGIGILINAGASDAVSLRGLTIDGQGVGIHGIVFTTGKSLTIENCVIRNAASEGILMTPSGSASFFLSNTEVAENGGRGITLQPTGAVTITAIFSRMQLHNKGSSGLAVDGSVSTGTINAVVNDSVSSKGNAGYFVVSDTAKAVTNLMVFRSLSANNNTGLLSQNPNATLRVS
jgi:hypothetical protein